MTLRRNAASLASLRRIRRARVVDVFNETNIADYADAYYNTWFRSVKADYCATISYNSDTGDGLVYPSIAFDMDIILLLASPVTSYDSGCGNGTCRDKK